MGLDNSKSTELEFRGLIPRVAEYIMNDKSMETSSQLGVSFIEIYQEQIQDLLDSSKKDIVIREDSKGNVQLANVTQFPVLQLDDIFKLTNISLIF